MSESKNIREVSGPRNWTTSILRYDLNQLRREREHLVRKTKERLLSEWEKDRLVDLDNEIVKLIRRLVARQTYSSGQQAA